MDPIIDRLIQYGALGAVVVWFMVEHRTTLKALRMSNHELRNAIMELRAVLFEHFRNESRKD